MKCPNCNAEIDSKSNSCEYCGAEITPDMRRQREKSNMSGCPKCGSTNIQFKRENQGEVRKKNTKKVVHRTVAFCKDCGYTWYPNNPNEKKKGKTWLWVLGWICIFPIPLTILMLRKKDLKPAIKYGIIAAAWIIYLIIAFSGKNDNNNTTNENNSEPAKEVVAEEPTKDIVEDTGDKDESIELIAGQTGEYGKELVLNEGTEFEDKTIGYFVPAGKYEVTNIGDHMTQVNVYKNEKNVTDEGWEEWKDTHVDLLDVNETKEITVDDGYFINIDDPSHIKIKKIDDGKSSNSDSDLISDHSNDIVAAAKLALDNYITGYNLSLAPQKWTMAKFDETETTVIAMTDISYNGKEGKYIYVGTLNINSTGKVESAQPHYLEVNGEVLGDDGYAKDVFDKIKAIGE